MTNAKGLNKKKEVSAAWKLIIAIILCQSVGIISALLSSPNNDEWFATLNKPAWNPPAYLFAPVWTILYLLMAVSLWLIWKSKPIVNGVRQSHLPKNHALQLFALQLFLNFWWSIIFFKFHSTAFALLDIVLLLIAILLTIFSFSQLSKLAAWLLVPYIAWVSFATVLNYSIWFLNK